VSAPGGGSAARERLLVGALVAAFVLAPIAVAAHPPVLDLPQQAAQIRLFARALAEPGGALEIDWSGPNRLSYPLVALGLALGGAGLGPRIALALCAFAFVAAIFLLARKLGRPREHALLATLFLTAHVYYGGFLGFLVGALAMALWLVLLAAPREEVEREAPLRTALRFLGVGLLLYFGHVLYLLVAGLLLVVVGGRERSLRRLVIGLTALAPFVLATALWYAGLTDTRWDSTFRYDTGLLQRLTIPEFWSTWTLGGLRGSWEAVIELAVLAWTLFCLRPSNPRRGERDRWLGRVALVLALFAYLAPDAIGDTVLFNRRWAIWAAAAFLLSLPPSGLGRRVSLAIPALLLVAHGAVTTLAWRGFERDEMGGFDEALAAVPDGARLLELDFARRSPRFWLEPFFQMGAYAQLDRDVTLAYSFASAPSSLVRFADPSPWPFPWTQGLEHHPDRLVPADLDHFDHLLLHAPPEAQAEIAARTRRLEEIAGRGAWRLYRVTLRPAAAPERDGPPV